jgi:hypothetical protein
MFKVQNLTTRRFGIQRVLATTVAIGVTVFGSGICFHTKCRFFFFFFLVA